jgi:glyoxylase I family protein
MISRIHHIAIICSDHDRSKHFYVNILGLSVRAEIWRKDRPSWKTDLAIGDNYVIELFSFPDPPTRLTRPEATGLRHLAFAVPDLDQTIAHLAKHDVETEPIRIDEWTGRRFTFARDPDGLPIEFYETEE